MKAKLFGTIALVVLPTLAFAAGAGSGAAGAGSGGNGAIGRDGAPSAGTSGGAMSGTAGANKSGGAMSGTVGANTSGGAINGTVGANTSGGAMSGTAGSHAATGGVNNGAGTSGASGSMGASGSGAVNPGATGAMGNANQMNRLIGEPEKNPVTSGREPAALASNSCNASHAARRCCLQRPKTPAANSVGDCAKSRKRRRMKRRHAPVRPDDLVGVERLVAIAAEVERGAVRQHFNLDFADQRIDGFVVGAGLMG